MSGDNTQLPQERICNAVEARGYFADYDGESIVGRQLLKAVEELAEALEHIYPVRTTNGQQDAYNALADTMKAVSQTARKLFDARVEFGLWRTDELARELADIAIPIFVAAQVMGVDLIAESVAKATTDIARGVRKS